MKQAIIKKNINNTTLSIYTYLMWKPQLDKGETCWGDELMT